jgi:hypothetical protein
LGPESVLSGAGSSGTTLSVPIAATATAVFLLAFLAGLRLRVFFGGGSSSSGTEIASVAADSVAAGVVRARDLRSSLAI